MQTGSENSEPQEEIRVFRLDMNQLQVLDNRTSCNVPYRQNILRKAACALSVVNLRYYPILFARSLYSMAGISPTNTDW